jgi:hypothetical protein
MLTDMKPRHAATGRYLMLLGAGCLVIVVLTHVCETFHLFPAMGWGLKHSPAIISTSAPLLSASLSFLQDISLRSRPTTRASRINRGLVSNSGRTSVSCSNR